MGIIKDRFTGLGAGAGFPLQDETTLGDRLEVSEKSQKHKNRK